MYIHKNQQDKIKNAHILMGGAGLGSVIAEALLRLGFLNFTIIDADWVEESNLNRQNYVNPDIGTPKVNALANRLKKINPGVNLEAVKVYLGEKNVGQYVKNCDVAINAIDYSSEAPFIFDRICAAQSIPVIHPFNVGWAGLVYVVTPQSLQIANMKREYKHFEFTIIDHTIHWVQTHLKQDIRWIEDFREEYWKRQDESPSQLSVASYVTAGITASVIFSIVNKLPFKTFPEPYFCNTRCRCEAGHKNTGKTFRETV